MPGGFDSYPHPPSQMRIKLLGFSVGVFQAALNHFACLLIQHRDLLVARM
jgi:hypothetical protein